MEQEQITFELIGDHLLCSIQKLIGIVERRQTLPILSHILLSLGPSGMTVTASDGEIQMQVFVESTIDTPISFTVNARKCVDILKGIPLGTKIKSVLGENKVTIYLGKGRYSLATLPDTEFPILNLRDNTCHRISMAQSTFKKWLILVRQAASTQDIRFFLQGLELKVVQGSLFLVATDGHRMAYAHLLSDVETVDFSVILPHKTVNELCRTLSDKDEIIDILVTTHQICFSYGTMTLLSKLIEGTFPNHLRLLPTDFNSCWTLDRLTALQSLHRISVFCNDKFPCVRLLLSDGKLTFLSLSTDVEEACEELDLAYHGISCEVAYNIVYLIDVLSVCPDGPICFSLSAEKKSLLISPTSDQACYGYLVMPLRI